MAEVDVLDAGREPQLGALEVSLQAPVGTVPDLAVDQQPEPLLEAEHLVLGAFQLLGQGAGHPGEAQGVEVVQGRVDEHGGLLFHW